MTISHDLKLIFIHVHRTGGSTIRNLLKQELGSKIENISQHGNAMSSESVFLEKHADYFRFGFVRNPWDRLLSWYSLINKWDPLNIELERLRFEEFLELDLSAKQGDDFFHYNQLDYFPLLNDSLNSIKIYRYEKFEDETNEIFGLLGHPLKKIPITNNTSIKDYKDFYTERSKELVKQKCHKDITYFKYSF